MISKFLLLSFISFSGLTYASQVDDVIRFPKMNEVYSNQELVNRGCNPKNMEALFNQAEKKSLLDKQWTQNYVVKDQVQRASSVASNSAMKCLDGAVSAVKGISNSVDGLLGILNGSTSIGAIAGSIAKQLGDAACNSVDNYLTGSIYNNSNSVVGKVNQANSIGNNGVYVNTEVGQINVGGGAIKPGTNKTTSDAIDRVLK